MSMITATSETGFDGRSRRGVGWFEHLISAMRVSAALESNSRPEPRDLEALGIAEAYANYAVSRG